jgi:hypothetical protein
VKPTPLFLGATMCTECHTEPRDRSIRTLCQCTEFVTWATKDKHRDAYNVLLGERARQMGKLLQVRDVTQWDACLACHSVVLPENNRAHKSFRREEGITCVLCHGAYEDWYDPHGSRLRRDEWRSWSRLDKEKRYGLKDLWDPVQRATLCVSCHVGNAAEGKFVTHAMYAAGHPPLPGFEPAYFSNAMRHWQTLREKDADIQKILHYDGKDREQTKLVLVGAAVTLAESMKLLAEQCRVSARAAPPEHGGLDLANFDCYACHHDLKADRRRQRDGFAGKPGRVPLRRWPTVLVRLAIRHAAEGPAQVQTLTAELEEHLHQVQAGFSARPYGQLARIAPAAEALGQWAERLAGLVNHKTCDQAAGRRLLAELPSLYTNEVLDYDSARQIAWALQVLYKELAARPNAEVDTVLDSLNRSLQLDLPAERGQSEDQREQAVRQRLRALKDFNPDAFRIALEKLAHPLGEK